MKNFYLILALCFFCPTFSAQTLVVIQDSVQTTHTYTFRVEDEKSPWLAFGLSYIFPGMGQFYNGEVGKGLLFIGGIVAGAGIAVLGAGDSEHESSINKGFLYSGIAIAGIFELWQLIDAPVSASRINREKKEKRVLDNIKLNGVINEESTAILVRFYF